MDPNACLEELRAIADRMLSEEVEYLASGYIDDARRLAELVQALDGWLTGGGFLPRSWARK